MCALKRPFVEQTRERILSETRAVMMIFERIDQGLDEAVWSTALTVENDADPDLEVRMEVERFAARAVFTAVLLPEIEARLTVLVARGLQPLDAAHVAFAEASECDALVTCDDRLIKHAKRGGCLIPVMTPIEYIDEVDDGARTN
jgi:predicted nucleic acid-binding protein